MRSLAPCVVLISWPSSGFSADKFLEPSYAKNFYYLSGKYVVNVQSYREYDDLWVLDLPDMDLFRGTDLKFKIGQVLADGIVLNDKYICKYRKHFGDIETLIFKKSDATKLKNGKLIAERACHAIIGNEFQFRVPEFLEYRKSDDMDIVPERKIRANSLTATTPSIFLFQN